MNPEIVQSICDEIYRRFPNISGQRPKVQAQRAQAKSPGTNGPKTYLLTFPNHGTNVPKGLTGSLRVVVNEKGKILKVSTSR